MTTSMSLHALGSHCHRAGPAPAHRVSASQWAWRAPGIRCRAPATTGNDVFERYFRVHMNTVEQLLVFVPAIWLFASLVSAKWAALLGAVYLARPAGLLLQLREGPAIAQPGVRDVVTARDGHAGRGADRGYRPAAASSLALTIITTIGSIDTMMMAMVTRPKLSLMNWMLPKR